MIYWAVGVIGGLVLLIIFVSQMTKRTCMKAFGQGVEDAHELAWEEIPNKYHVFLNPMRPMDAAAYKRGLEYALLCSDIGDWKAMNDDFLAGYKSGEITAEGTAIRKMGSERAGKNFELRVSKKILESLNTRPSTPPLLTISQLGNKQYE